MAFCTECGHQLAAGAKFCFECGAEVNGPASPRIEQRKTVYDGEIHRCPNCGDVLGAYESVCKACGYELRGSAVSSVVKIFAEKLDKLESEPIHDSENKQPGSVAYTTLKTNRKISLITSFPIPNTKEDLLEFAIMAASNLETNYWNMSAAQQAISDAWSAKFEQAYQKAQFSFRSDPDFSLLQSLYNQKMEQKKLGLSKKKWRKAMPFIIIASCYLVLLLLALGIPLLVIALTGGFS